MNQFKNFKPVHNDDINKGLFCYQYKNKYKFSNPIDFQTFNNKRGTIHEFKSDA